MATGEASTLEGSKDIPHLYFRQSGWGGSGEESSCEGRRGSAFAAGNLHIRDNAKGPKEYVHG